MYYIYHIPGVKIGCSQNINKRISSQKFSHYEIIEEHSDVYIASNREIELQKQYGYKVDRIPYYESLKRITKAQEIALKTKNEWLPNVDWKARDAKVDFNKRAVKINSHPNYINRKFRNGSKQLIKPVYQYDLNGNFIKEWNISFREMKQHGFESAKRAAKENKIYKKYIWKYEKN